MGPLAILGSVLLLTASTHGSAPPQEPAPPAAPTERAAPPRVAGTLIVLNKSDATATLIDASTGKTRATVPTGDGPHEAAVTPDGRFVVVADYGTNAPGSTLTVIDIEKAEVARKIDLGEFQRPHGLAFIGTSTRLLVTAEMQKALIEVDFETGDVMGFVETDSRASHMVAATPDGKRAFVANIGSGTISAIDLENHTLLANIETGSGCEGVDVTPDGKQVWASNRAANTVSILDVATLKVVKQIETSSFPIRVKITPDGKTALVSCATAGVVDVIDVAKRERRKVVAMEWKAAAGTEGYFFAAASGDGAAPIGIQVHPDGRLAYVAASRANLVAVLDLETLEIVGAYDTGNQPDGLGWSAR